MLGRYETPGCCPGCRAGWKRRRRVHGLDCAGADTSTRGRKRAEAREWRREADEELSTRRGGEMS